MTSATGAATAGTGAPAGAAPRAAARIRPGEAAAVGLLLALTAVLYLWGLGASGWANSFYTAAAQAGEHSWKALFFGSSDGANAITVDKTPGFLWVIGLSVRVFGLNAWSVLVPQALEGVAAVGVLYAAVRRTSGHAAGLLAGAVLALTPVAVLMFRFNNPDALLVLMLTVTAYCLIRALERASLGWIVGCGAAVGFAFLAKELQAFVVLPAFVAAYLLAAPTTVRRRLAHLLAAAAAVAVSAGWYLAVVSLWPAGSRPYIGGSQHNSALELILGYNGLGRVTGDETGGLGNTDAEAGWARLFDSAMGGQIAWLIPAAAILTLAALWALRRRPRTDPRRAALVLWGGWLLVTGAVLSFAAGIVHPYYTVQLAPAVAGALGVAAPLLWRRRALWWARGALAAAAAATGILAGVLLLRTPAWHPWLAPTLVVAGIVVGTLLALAPQLAALVHGAGRVPRALGPLLAATAVVGALAGPAAYSVATAAAPHTGSIPTAGPAAPRFDPVAVFGGAHASAAGAGAPAFHRHSTLLDAAPAGPRLVALLRDDADRYTWAAATVGSNAAAGFQLSSGLPVMAVGGFNGTDPFPTLGDFQDMVAAGEIHYFIGSSSDFGGLAGTLDPLLPLPGIDPVPGAGTGTGPGAVAPWLPLPGSAPTPRTGARGHAAARPHGGIGFVPRAHGAGSGSDQPVEIARWVASRYTATEVDGEAVYDLSVPPAPQTAASAATQREVP